jgi:DNA replicative helicase MCM subunit Mcm2 (Cdc46/Mcm family)
VAVRVVMSFLERVAGGEGGGIDTDIITTGYASSQRDRIWSLIEIIKDIQGEDGAAKEDIVRLASERGLPTAKVNEDLERLKRDGRIYEKYDDKFRVA